MSDFSRPIDLEPDPPRAVTPTPPPPEPPSYKNSARRIYWPEVGVCAAAAGGLLWIAHFALTWDRLLVAVVFMTVGLALGHWLGSLRSQPGSKRSLLRGPWSRRARMAGAILAAAGAIELLAFSFAMFATVYDRSPTLEHFPLRPLLAGTFAMLLGAWIASRGWRASKDQG